MVFISERRLAKAFVAFTFFGMGAMLLHVTRELMNIEISNEQIKGAVESLNNALDSPDHVITAIKATASFPKKSTSDFLHVQHTDNLKNVWKYAATSNLQDNASAPKSIAPQLPDTRNDPPDQSKSVTPVPNGSIRSPLNSQGDLLDQTNTTGTVAQPVKNHNYKSKENSPVSSSSLPQGNGDVVNSNAQANVDSLQPCQKPGENQVGRLRIDQSIPNMDDIAKSWDEENWVLKGGAWRPSKCEAVSKVAIVIPYRDRYPQLKIFLRHLHPILKRQLLDYRIVVVEQNGNTPFNRAMLFNIGYKEALLFHDFQCFVFHDVDLLPEDDRNYYGCPSKPRHLSVAVDTMKYRLPYASIFGGVGSFTKEQFENINGFSNKFWGWGGEDDDLYRRIRAVNYTLSRPMMEVGRYTMVRIAHKSAAMDENRFEKLRDSAERMKVDGLNSLEYDIVKRKEHPLFTQITVNVDPNAV